MEKLTKNIRIGLIHLGFWALYAFLLFTVFNFMVKGKINTDRELLDTIFTWFLLFPAIASYLIYYWLVFNIYIKSNSLPKAIFSAAAVSLLVALVFTAAFELQINTSITFGRIRNVSYSLYVFNVFLCSVVGCIAFIIRVFHEWFNDQKVKRVLREENQKMQLEIVKAQLDPHFLFNSLNNIDVLIQKQPQKASEYLNKLSDLLRYTLNPAKSESVSLSTEIDYINQYIDLQRIRTTNQGLIDLEIGGDVKGKRIAPLLFIPFIENAFKYHQYADANAKIRVRLHSSNESIRFDCSNKISKVENKPFSSFQIGNELINKRLQLLYPESHELAVSQEDDIYHVSLIIR